MTNLETPKFILSTALVGIPQVHPHPFPSLLHHPSSPLSLTSTLYNSHQLPPTPTNFIQAQEEVWTSTTSSLARSKKMSYRTQFTQQEHFTRELTENSIFNCVVEWNFVSVETNIRMQLSQVKGFAANSSSNLTDITLNCNVERSNVQPLPFAVSTSSVHTCEDLGVGQLRCLLA
ncbi:hypothetical protein ABKN59_011622 [Abortiporus biennis]